jgi:hypothetical protein
VEQFSADVVSLSEVPVEGSCPNPSLGQNVGDLRIAISIAPDDPECRTEEQAPLGIVIGSV